MSEQPLSYEELPPLVLPVMPEATVWATSTDLEGTNKERKQYFINLHDGDKLIRFSLHVHADGMIHAEPFVDHEIDYWEYDGWEDEDDYESSYYDDEDYYPDEDEDEEDIPPPEFFTELTMQLEGK